MAHSTSPNPTPPDRIRPAHVSTGPASSGPDPGADRGPGPDGPLLVDCDSCRMLDTDACRDCVVAVLLADGPLVLDDEERDALDALAGAGLVPRLRLVPHAARDGEEGHPAV